MPRVEKTVFISYRRTNVQWALSIFQYLTHNGFDVFFDYLGIASGDFEQIIIENIRSRAHFLVLLTPTALERCTEPGDWLRREVEEAIACRRNIVPMMLDGFDFGAHGMASQLTGELGLLRRYNGLRVPSEYFDEAMTRLRQRYLNVALEALLHPSSENARKAARIQQTAAATASPAKPNVLTAKDWFERGDSATDTEEKLRCYGEAIRLKPNYADAYIKRGVSRRAADDMNGALGDCSEGIRLNPDYAIVGKARLLTGGRQAGPSNVKETTIWMWSGSDVELISIAGYDFVL